MSRYRVCRKGQILRFYANEKFYEFKIKEIKQVDTLDIKMKTKYEIFDKVYRSHDS